MNRIIVPRLPVIGEQSSHVSRRCKIVREDDAVARAKRRLLSRLVPGKPSKRSYVRMSVDCIFTSFPGRRTLSILR